MTPEFPYLKGNFTIAGCSVPYLQLSLSANDAISHLQVAREIIFDPTAIILEELFQRDIDEVRVQKEIAPYLTREGEIKFFNSMVVVLLPRNNGELLSNYPAAKTSGDEVAFGGVEMRVNGNAGTIRWDPAQVCPIIVDGQHRFFALREVSENATASICNDLAETSIPVIVLPLHKTLGFKSSNESLLSTVRRIFIDLNRQAKTVSETRNILLDDRDIAANAVRLLLEKYHKAGEATLVDRFERRHLPLALVDWYSDKLKFDHGVHITTILSLYQIIGDWLSIPKLDPYDYEKADRWLKRFLELSPLLDFRPTVDDCINNKRPIFLQGKDVQVFAKWFESDWGPAIASVLIELRPYKQFSGMLENVGFLGGPLEPWAALDKAGKAVIEQSHENPEEIHRLVAEASEYKQNDLAFQVVFQRGVLRAFAEMCAVHLSLDQIGSTQASATGYAAKWVTAFNDRLGDLTKDHHFWSGIAFRADTSINATRTAEKAIAATVIFILLAPFSDWRGQDKETQVRLATSYIHQSYDLRTATSNLESWERLKKNYSQPLRSLVRKFLQDSKGIFGRAESEACSLHIGERLLLSLRQVPNSSTAETEEPQYVSDPLIDLLKTT